MFWQKSGSSDELLCDAGDELFTLPSDEREAPMGMKLVGRVLNGRLDEARAEEREEEGAEDRFIELRDEDAAAACTALDAEEDALLEEEAPAFPWTAEGEEEAHPASRKLD